MMRSLKSIECTKLKDYLYKLDSVLKEAIIHAYQDNISEVEKNLLKDFSEYTSQIIAICKERNKF